MGSRTLETTILYVLVLVMVLAVATTVVPGVVDQLSSALTKAAQAGEKR